MDKHQEKDSENKNKKSGKDQNQPRQRDKETQDQKQRLTKEDLPDSTNESRGTTGSGQRQDSN